MLVKNTKMLTSEAVHIMMSAALARAQEMGIKVSIAIVDAGGHLLMFERMVGAPFHTVRSSATKAITASSSRLPTSAKGAQAQAFDVLHALGLALAAGAHAWTPLEGGYPVILEDECVGAVGVSGGDSKQDQYIARAALRSVGAFCDEKTSD